MTDGTEVFISYSSKDSEWVARLARSLSERGLPVWRDSGNLRAGDQFPDALGVALDSCDAVVLVVSAHSIKSDWVNWELNRVRSRRPGTRIIPVRIDDTPTPAALAETHSVDFRAGERYEAQVDRLVWAGVRGTPLACLVLHGVGAMPWPALTEPEFAALSADARAAWTKAQRHLSNCIHRARTTRG
jgi:TIR domain